MNNFDFSLYDPEDDSPIVSPKKMVKKEENDKPFSFDDYDYFDEPTENTELPQSEVTFKTPEEINKLTPEERLAYNIQQQDQSSKLFKNFTKSAASGATLGYSEKNDPIADEDRSVVGELIGSAIPITGIGTAISLPVKAGASLIKNAPRVANTLSRLMTSFGTGASYEGGKQAVKGEGFDTGEILKTGATFATIDSLFGAGTKAYKWLKGLTPSQQATILEQQVIPKDLPKSQYATAEEILKQLYDDTFN